MSATVECLGALIRSAREPDWEKFLFVYISRPIDDCWADTSAAVVEIDRYEPAPDPVTIVGVEYHPCLDFATILEIRTNAFHEIPNPTDDLLVAALRHYYLQDGFMPLITEPPE